MNKLLFFLLPFLFAQALFAQTAIIAGHCHLSRTNTVTIQYYSSAINYIEGSLTRQEVSIVEQRNFRFEIETDIPLRFNINNGDWLYINQYIAPGDSTWFEFGKEGLGVSGGCEKCFGFMTVWEDKFLTNPVANKQFNTSYERLEPMEFAMYWDVRRMAQLVFFKEYFQDKTAPETFRSYMEHEINYGYAVALLQYSWRNKSAEEVLKDTAYIAFLQHIPIDNQGAVNSTAYLHFLRELPYSIWRTYVDFKNETDPVSQYFLKSMIHVKDSIAKRYFTGKAYELALYRILYDEVSAAERLRGQPHYDHYYRVTDSIVNIYGALFKDQSYKSRLQDKLHSLNKPDRSAPDFALMDLNGKKVNLSDFKGKVVYLDFWATNCAPCVAEIPAANALKEKFGKKDVVFLYVSFDRSPEKLKSFIESKTFEGIHLNDPKGFASKVAELYEVNSLPRYFLIDKKGFIVNSDAPRPGANPEKLIDSLLK
jgi:peroxiredoxin